MKKQVFKFMINILWKILKLFIIIYNDINKIITYFIKFINANIAANASDIIFVKNSLVVLKANYNNINNYNIPDYDYIVYNQINDDKTLTVIVDTITEIDRININDNTLIPCKMTFLFVKILTENNTYDITSILNSEKNYYYVNNSILFNSLFIDWICINHLYIELNDYTIIIMDNTITEKTINSNQFIQINNDNYDIVTI
jgi:hypothetical protein